MIDNRRPIFIGIVIEALPNTTFKVKIDNDTEILAHLSGKMRLNFIRVLVGDRVEVELSVDKRRGRIIRRLWKSEQALKKFVPNAKLYVVTVVFM